MLDRQEVRSDVGLVVRAVVIDKTLFDESDYDREAIPIAEPMGGWEATLPNWSLILGRVEGVLHAMKAEYRVLSISESDAERTLTQPLFLTCELLTNLIMAGNERLMRSPSSRGRRKGNA